MTCTAETEAVDYTFAEIGKDSWSVTTTTPFKTYGIVNNDCSS
jgi:hypothetical protein